MKLKVFAGFVLGITILALLFYFAGFTETITLLLNIKTEMLFLVLIFFVFTYPATVLHYYVCLIPIKKIPFFRLMKYFLFSWVIGLFAFGKLGEFSMIYFLKNETNTGISTAIFMFSKVITIIFISIVSIIGLLTFFGLSYSFYFVLSIILLCFLLLIIFFTAFGRNLLRGLVGPFKKKFTGFGKTLNEIIRNRKDVVIIAFIAVAFRFIVLSLFYVVLFSAFNVQVGLIEMFFISCTTTLIAFLPITPNGIGLREGSFAFLASAMNLPLPVITSVLLVSLALSYLAGFAVAVLSIKEIIPALNSLAVKGN